MGLFFDEFEKRWNEAPLDRSDLRGYQVDELIPFLRATPKSAAYVGMGLGKTGSILTLVSDLLFEEQIQKVLIIAPVRVAVQTWPTELSKWKHLLWLQHSLIRPDENAEEVKLAMRIAREAARDDILFTPSEAARRAQTAVYRKQRIRAAHSGAPIHIVNREFVEDLIAHFIGPMGTRSKKRIWPYDCIIVDESTSFADQSSARFKALKRVTHLTKRVHLLSGTPAPEGIQQLFPQCYLLDQGKRFGNNITFFRNNYMKQNIYTKKWEPQKNAVEEVSTKMSDIALVMKEEDYLPLDEPVVVERPIVMTAEQLAAYKEFEETSVIEIAEGDFIEAVNSGVLSGKLLQYASGFVYQAKVDPELEKIVKVVKHVHDHKIEEMKELVKEVTSPLLVAYWFKPSLDRLQKAFPKATTMDKEGRCVDAWNKGKIPMLFIHPQSAGHGLNMQLGPGHHLIFYDTPASLELYLQIIKRIARFGQKRIVRIIHLVTQGTLERLAVPNLRVKENNQEVIISYLRGIRARAKRKAA